MFRLETRSRRPAANKPPVSHTVTWSSYDSEMGGSESVVMCTANYSLRRPNVPNELIRRVASRLDLHHLRPEDEPTGTAALSPEVRSCDPTSSRSSVLVFIAFGLDWMTPSQFHNFLMDCFWSERAWCQILLMRKIQRIYSCFCKKKRSRIHEHFWKCFSVAFLQCGRHLTKYSGVASPRLLFWKLTNPGQTKRQFFTIWFHKWPISPFLATLHHPTTSRKC